MKKPIIAPVTALPYDGRRLLRSLAYGDCRYSVATQSAAQTFRLTESKLASEYGRLLLVGGGDAVQAFVGLNRDDMVKKTSKTDEMKKAFSDVHDASVRMASIIVDGVRLGAVSSFKKVQGDAVLFAEDGRAGLRVGIPDAFWYLPGKLMVVAFTSWLSESDGSPWYSALLPEAWAAMAAAGVAECTLVAAKGDDTPMVRAVAVKCPSPAASLSAFLAPFVDDCRRMRVEACMCGSCRECSDACIAVDVEDMRV